MAIKLHFTPPGNYNLSGYQLGQSAEAAGTLAVVASGTAIGTFPDWIDELSWSGGAEYYYAIRFITDDQFATAWSNPRTHGRYGVAGFNWFIHYPSGRFLYIVPQPTSGSAAVPNWLSFNTQYTVTIESSGFYGSGMAWLEEDYSFSFTAEYCPVFSTPDSVRIAVGPIIDGIPDDTIYRMIQRASWDVISRYYNETNPYGCTYTSVPESVYRWVTCAAGLQALNAAIAGGGGLGNTSKRLGTFAVSYDGATDEAAPGDIRKNLTECMFEASTIISAGQETGIQYAVKSFKNTLITHPQKDVAWGRMPRKIPDTGITGPWKDATRDYKTYEDTAGLTEEGGYFVSGTYYI
jgi:hypothetical protein